MALRDWPLLLLAFLFFFQALSPTSADLSAHKAFVFAATHESPNKAAQHLRGQSVERVCLLDVDDVGSKTLADLVACYRIVKVQIEELSEIGGSIAVVCMWAYNNRHMHTVAVRDNTINLDLSAYLIPAGQNVYKDKALRHLGLDVSVNQMNCYSTIYALLGAFATPGYHDFPFVISKKGLGVGKDSPDYGHSFEFTAIYARNLKLHHVSGLELPRYHRVEVSRFRKRFPDMSSIRKPSRVLGEVGLNASEIAGVGANDTVVGQVSLSGTDGRSWCIAKDYATPDSVQGALDWACGFGGADCQPIQLGNPCFVPNTVYNHASYAFNSYYQIHQHASGTCDFDGVATVTYEDPSYPGCSYPFRVGQPGAPVGGASERHNFVCQAFSGVLVLLLMWMM